MSLTEQVLPRLEPVPPVDPSTAGARADGDGGADVRPRPPRRTRPTLARLARQPGLLLAWTVLALVALAAAVPELFTDHDPLRPVGPRLTAPDSEFLFGTDNLGRDLFTRVVYGTAESVQAVVVAVLVGLVVGSLLGLLAGYLGGWVDDVLMRVVDVLLAVPALLISLAFITALGFGTVNIAIAVGIGNVASFARVMRAEVLRIRGSAFVEAATFAGIGRLRLLARHILPHTAGPVLVLATLELGLALLSVSALSFLGFGAPPPAPEWGSLVAGGRDYLAAAWWMASIPGFVIAATVLSANRIARSVNRHQVSAF
ncbi:ABC transporter permease [Micromonospora echinofusca]|uniref:ABC transporter permease subunit n=1 Tax=Micromonospora echinofusca TaxID=47858 RepID=A0ABS3VQF4_MICEH|nr:ABC transporter permease [Micromonospora echinofusca]MBO4206774.1 ABC transporter permease subunit [Micromonospora echinofusca]